MASSVDVILSPVTTKFPFLALHNLEGRAAKIPKGATGKPQVSALVDLVQVELIDLGQVNLLGEQGAKITNRRRQAFSQVRAATMSRFPTLKVNGLSSVSEDPTSATTPTERTAEREDKRLAMLRRMRPPPLKYAWNFYHDKHSETKSYDERITLVVGNILTLKPFWGTINNFPMHALKLKDSVHFFKRGIKPVWEDSRNINGGAWTFRVPKDKSELFWRELLMLAIGEQFAADLQPRDDINGLSYVTRYNSNLLTIWNRDGSNQTSIDGILSTVLSNLSPELQPKPGSYHYKKHSEHSGFEAAVAKAREDAKAKIERSEAKKIAEKEKGKVEEDGGSGSENEEALVTEEEGNKAMLKDAEGEDVGEHE
ncbi:MAG: hypothetical protein Q9195_008748 [Heterodermia aff. obscurata]